MSGIAGIIHFDRMPVQAGSLERMTAAMSHRGRDGLAHWRDGWAALGHCLLRTTADSAEERQPLADVAAGVVLVFDGRIDNSAELARELRGHGLVLHSRADSELVLQAYRRWGDGLVEHLDGDFALALWNMRTERLLCARDRTGNRPFHYHWNGTAFSFASDASALLALPWVDAQLNLDFIAEHLAMEWTSLEDTFWRGIQRLPPAHRLVVSAGGCDRSCYWHPRLDAVLPCRTEDEYAAYYRDLLQDVVRRMGRSTGRVACEVSGGLDSSALFAVAVDLQRRGTWPAPGVDGYTLDFRGGGAADEMDYALAVAQHVGQPVTAVAPTRQPLAWYGDWARREGYPAGYPNGVMGLGIRDEARRRGSNCLIVGVGGDEWLDGYPYYYAEAMAGYRWRELLKILARDGRDAGIRPAGGRLLRYGAFPLLPAALRGAVRRLRRRWTKPDEWLTESMQQRLAPRRAALSPDDARVIRVGQRAQLRQLHGAYSLLARESEERLCAWAGLEIRRPFWDARMIEFALATPERVRLEGTTTRALHRRAMAGLLPESVVRRDTKADFMVAFQWSAEEMRRTLTGAIPDVADWVSSRSLQASLQDYGDPRLEGGPEWRAWSLFNCYTVRQAATHPARAFDETPRA